MARNTTELGEYFETTPGGGETLGDYFSMTPGGDLTGFGGPLAVSGSPDGLGALGRVANLSPLLRDVQNYRRSTKGLGQDPSVPSAPVSNGGMPSPSPATLMVGVLTGAVVRGVAGYWVGKAVAPSAQSERKYALWGIPVGIFFGTLGLGIEAAIALSKK